MKVKNLDAIFFFASITFGIVLFGFSNSSQASVSGPCSNCHTMHNSQGGQLVDDTGPNPTLLTNDCIGCHSSSESSTYYALAGGCNVPVVLYTGGAPTEYLAGGNFWWVKEGLGGNDTKGHNVFLNEDDDYLDEAPGCFPTCVDGCHENFSRPYPSGDDYGNIGHKYGCQGCHINVRHHANDHPNGESGLVDSVEKGWYRFLSGHDANKGVKGYEDGNWEAGHPDLSPGTDAHNEYTGHTGSHVYIIDDVTGFCTACHANFSSAYAFSDSQGQVDSHGHWIRHPSDAIIPDEGEYADVGGATHLYDPLTPVAKPAVDDSPDTTVTPGADMVMCLSCHRPHGSPYPDMLRWDYTQQIAGGGGDDGKGCFYCHTLKDD